MKQALKRIEEALNQLETRKNGANAQPDTAKRSYSFDLLKLPKSNSPKQTKEAAKSPELPYFNALGDSCLCAEQTSLEVSPLPENLIEDTDDRRRAGGSEGGGGEILIRLEKFGGGKPTPPRQFVHRAQRRAHDKRDFSQNLKSKSQNSGVSPEEAIEQVVHQIQDLYHSGPIVNGYLEYYPPAPEPSDPTLREVCFERVIDNLEEVGMTSGQEVGRSGASYRICGVDASGQQWSYPCPSDQLPSVSMAIARYQKLQQLLQQKHELEQVASD